jgi:hypothetical protein
VSAPLPYKVSGAVGPVSTDSLRETTASILSEKGFEVGVVEEPNFTRKWTPGSESPLMNGTITGERRFTIEAGLRDQAKVRSQTLSILGVALTLISILLATVVSTEWIYLIVLGLVLVLFSTTYRTAMGSFNSEIIYVQYLALLGATIDYPPLTPSTPLTFTVKIGAGRISSQNDATRSSKWRAYTSVLPGGEEMASYPASILAELLAAPGLAAPLA